MPMSQNEVLKFYETLADHNNLAHLDAVRSFLPKLFNSRSLDGCTLFTSHHILCIVRYPSYAEWQYRPCMAISSPVKHRLLIELRITLSYEPVIRTITESANCPLHLALEEFDRLYVKFLDAHNVQTSSG